VCCSTSISGSEVTAGTGQDYLIMDGGKTSPRHSSSLTRPRGRSSALTQEGSPSMSKHSVQEDGPRGSAAWSQRQSPQRPKVTLGPQGTQRSARHRSPAAQHEKKSPRTAWPVGGEKIGAQDQLRDIGAQMIKEGASKTSDRPGWTWTTTATVLAPPFYRQGLKKRKASHTRANPDGASAGQSTRPWTVWYDGA